MIKAVIALVGMGFALWLAAQVANYRVARAHRLEFLTALRIPFTPTSVASDSGLKAYVRSQVLLYVPLGSDTLVVKEFAEGRDLTSALLDDAGLVYNRGLHMWWIDLPERSRWYEIGICGWSRELGFAVDPLGKVRDIIVIRSGACL
jgi:hypothetical protein